MGRDDPIEDYQSPLPLNRRRLLALTGVIAGGFAGCSGDSGETPTATASPTATGTAETGMTPTTQRTGDGPGAETPSETATAVPRVEELAVSFPKNPADRIWNQLNWSKYPGPMLNLSMTATAVRVRGGNIGELHNVMVAEYTRQGGGPTPPTFEVTLKEGFPWSDGDHEVTAKDYLTTLYLQGESYRPWREGGIISETEVVDTYTARVEFGLPYNPIQARRFIKLGTWGRPFVISPHWQWADLVQSLREASTTEERDSLITDASQRNIGTGEVITNGPWKITQHSATEIIWEPLEGHPLADNLPAERLVGKVAKGTSRVNQLLINNEIDIGGAPNQEIQGELPDSYQQVATWDSDVGRKLYLNWNNKHVARLGVRRAIVSLLDLPSLGELNAGTRPHHPTQIPVGPVTRDSWLEDSFLEKLHHYPQEADTERAAEFMRQEGYTKDGDEWTDEEGDAVSLRLLSWPPWATMTESIASQFQDFGFRTKKSVMEQGQWFQTVNSPGGGYAMTLYPMPGRLANLRPGGNAGWTTVPHLANKTDERSANNQLNIAPVPEEIGALEIDGEGEEINLALTQTKYWAKAASPEDLRTFVKRFSRFYNFYLNDIAITHSVGQAWGDTETFDFPADDATTWRAAKRPIWSTVKGQIEDIDPKPR